LLAFACSEGVGPTDPVTDLSFQTDNAPLGAGAVYLMTNAAGSNEVLVYHRAADGSLTADAPVATGGDGTGAGLGNQAALALTKDGNWLLVVNPGSDDVSAFRVGPGGLELRDVAASGGDMPVSVAVHGSLVYVLNAGMPNNVSGFTLEPDGSLVPLSGSSRALSDASTGPAQVGFSPDGGILVVTEKATSRITTYVVGADGLLSGPNSQSSAGETPFGFEFNQRGILIVSEAFGGAADASTVSSYRVGGSGQLTSIDPAVPTTETAACWIAVSGNGRYAYSTNGGSGSVSGLAVGHDGDLELLDADGRTGVTGPGSTPLDAAFSNGSRYLFVLSSGTHEISIFRLGVAGDLTFVDGVPGLPATANGMVAR
jgi:6-phosphogluconolactonase (cycloisomerase 2 family)